MSNFHNYRLEKLDRAVIIPRYFAHVAFPSAAYPCHFRLFRVVRLMLVKRTGRAEAPTLKLDKFGDATTRLADL